MKYLPLLVLLFITACNSSNKVENNDSSTVSNPSSTIKANVTEVTAQGNNGNFSFFVTLESDETGCDQYADWWEVLNSDGELVYRRVLLHSHPDTQPFTRGGSPVPVQADDTVYIRAHMNNAGYTGDVFTGSVNGGFLKADNPPAFSQGIAEEQPLPNGCAF